MSRYAKRVEDDNEETMTEGVAITVADNPDQVKKVVYPYARKIDFKRFTGELATLPDAPKDTKGKVVKESIIDVAKRSQFFSNTHGNKYKIIMVYKGAGNNKHQQLFDIVKKRDKNKIAFFKDKGIII